MRKTEIFRGFNGGVDLWGVGSANLGRPILPPIWVQALAQRDLGTLWTKMGRAQNLKFQPPSIQSLRGPVAILFISRDTRSDSIAKLFRACFYGVSQLLRDMLQDGVSHRCACVKLSTKGGYRTILGKC